MYVILTISFLFFDFVWLPMAPVASWRVSKEEFLIIWHILRLLGLRTPLQFEFYLDGFSYIEATWERVKPPAPQWTPKKPAKRKLE